MRLDKYEKKIIKHYRSKNSFFCAMFNEKNNTMKVLHDCCFEKKEKILHLKKIIGHMLEGK